MRTVTVVALKPLTYQGRSHVRGDVFQADPVDVIVLRNAKEADFAATRQNDHLQTRAMSASDQAAPPDDGGSPPLPTPRKRPYRRRDMSAEPSTS